MRITFNKTELVTTKDGLSNYYCIVLKSKKGTADWSFHIPISDIAKYGNEYEKEMIRHNKKLAHIFHDYIYNPYSKEVK